MVISWQGFNYFRIQNSQQSIVFNPYSLDNATKYSKVKADIAIFSNPKAVAACKMDEETLKIVHQSLFDYYNTELAEINIRNIYEIDKQALIEAFYHGKSALEPYLLYDWFNEVTKIFVDAAQFKIILPLSEELLKIIEKNSGIDNPEYINALQNYARLNEFIGKYKIAEPLFQTVLEFKEKKSRVLFCNIKKE
jgi:tetratricopeptide (TPR) repeat protein